MKMIDRDSAWRGGGPWSPISRLDSCCFFRVTPSATANLETGDTLSEKSLSSLYMCVDLYV